MKTLKSRGKINIRDQSGGKTKIVPKKEKEEMEKGKKKV